MAFPTFHLPQLQNWSCHNCGGCCRKHEIEITPQERDRILGQGWPASGKIPPGQPLFREQRSLLGRQQIFLAHQPDGGCVFLDDQGLCRIHGKFGEAAKPLACRVYPYAFHPRGKELAVSLRFSCPSVARNLGRPVGQQRKDLQTLARLVLPEGLPVTSPPRLSGHSTLSWDDLLLVVDALRASISREDGPVVLQILRTLFWLDLIEKSRLSKITGERLRELLNLLSEAALLEIPELPVTIEPVSRIGLTQFRLLAGQYARTDTAASIDVSLSGRWRQLRNGWSLTRGTGVLPDLDDEFRSIPFDALHAIPCRLPAEADEMLRRYLQVKIEGLHFCGRAYYDVPMIEGFHALILALPVVGWIACWRAASAGRAELTFDDVLAALNRVDHQHGYSPVLASWGARRRVKNLQAAGDIEKLLLHFSRPVP
jgi:lysine-N-methylase